MRKRLTLPPAAVLLAAVSTVPAWAQSPDETLSNPGEGPAALDDLVVTASLEPVARNEVVSSVSVITREDIEARQVKTVGDLLRDVPGFNVSQSGGVKERQKMVDG